MEKVQLQIGSGWWNMSSLILVYNSDHNAFGRESSPPHLYMTSITLFLSHPLIQLCQTTDPQQSISHLFGTLPPEVQIKMWTYGCTAMCRQYDPPNPPPLAHCSRGFNVLTQRHIRAHSPSQKLLAMCHRTLNYCVTCKAFNKNVFAWEFFPFNLLARFLIQPEKKNTFKLEDKRRN